MSARVESLAAQMTEHGLPVYCIFDGAVIDDINVFLNNNHLHGRPIFNDRKDVGIALAGPWVVSARSAEDTRRCFLLAQDNRTGVAWCASCGPDEMTRHLRTLNVAQLPTDGLVYFRHYDPDVLAFVCPLLDEGQAARLLGPARCLGFLSGRGEGSVVHRPDGLPAPPSGPLAFHDWQVQALEERQQDLSRRKICRFLRHVLPRETGPLSDDALLDEVSKHQQSACGLGLDTERSITQWTHLSLLSRGASLDHPAVHATVLKDGVAEANRNLDDNFFGMLKHFEERRLGFGQR